MKRDSDHWTVVPKLIVRRDWLKLLAILFVGVIVPTLAIWACQVVNCLGEHTTWPLTACLLP